jgi:hypothetical protein
MSDDYFYLVDKCAELEQEVNNLRASYMSLKIEYDELFKKYEEICGL